MPPKKEPWWVCTCGAPIHRTKRPDPGNTLWKAHEQVCPIRAEVLRTGIHRTWGMSIRQLSQGKR